MHCQGLHTLAWIKWYHSEHPEAQMHAYEAQRLASISADLYKEASALRIESLCCYTLGNYKKSIFLSNRARHLISLCGLSNGDLDHRILSNQAEIHKLKSEYVEARTINMKLLEEICIDKESLNYAVISVNIAEIDVFVGSKHQKNYDTARKIFTTVYFKPGLVMCDTILADLYLREGNMSEAKHLFERCIQVSQRSPGNSETIAYCLERLGNANR